MQEGYIAALRAMRSYDPERGSVDAYVRVCARNGMRSYLRKNRRERFVEDEAIDERLQDTLQADAAERVEDDEEIREIRAALCGLLDVLSPFERRALRAYLSTGSLDGAARLMHCEKKKTDNALQRVRNKARLRMQFE